MSVSIVQKYNVPGPRYTSYPTVPYWEEEKFHLEDWKRTLLQSFKESNASEGISLYIHLPFCESLCTFCGCNKRITKRHEVEDPYITAVIKEWKLYCDLFPRKPIIKEIHLGGGTPTFFSPENLERLMNGIFQYATKAEQHEFSFEGHPNNTTHDHLQKLYDLGFRRVSFGVQDYAEKVQNAWLKTIEDGIHTYDIYKEGISKQKVSTKEFTQAVIENLGQKPTLLKEVSYANNAALTLPKYVRKPAAKKELVGVDLFLHWDGLNPDELAQRVKKIECSGLKLTMITNRGIKVWPDGFEETFCTDHWRCRFKNSYAFEVSKTSIIELLFNADKEGLDVIKTENLYQFNGKEAFSLGQGQ